LAREVEGIAPVEDAAAGDRTGRDGTGEDKMENGEKPKRVEDLGRKVAGEGSSRTGAHGQGQEPPSSTGPSQSSLKKRVDEGIKSDERLLKDDDPWDARSDSGSSTKS
jgi:hypothetical protein